MSNRTEDIQRILSSEDDEFRRWLEEHHACESRLSELASKAQVTVEEEVESCATYAEACRVRRAYHALGRDCVIRFVGSAGGGD